MQAARSRGWHSAAPATPGARQVIRLIACTAQQLQRLVDRGNGAAGVLTAQLQLRAQGPGPGAAGTPQAALAQPLHTAFEPAGFRQAGAWRTVHVRLRLSAAGMHASAACGADSTVASPGQGASQTSSHTTNACRRRRRRRPGGGLTCWSLRRSCQVVCCWLACRRACQSARTPATTGLVLGARLAPSCCSRSKAACSCLPAALLGKRWPAALSSFLSCTGCSRLVPRRQRQAHKAAVHHGCCGALCPGPQLLQRHQASMKPSGSHTKTRQTQALGADRAAGSKASTPAARPSTALQSTAGRPRTGQAQRRRCAAAGSPAAGGQLAGGSRSCSAVRPVRAQGQDIRQVPTPGNGRR